MGSHPVADHVCTSGRTFCGVCGKLVDRDALRSIAVRPTNPGSKVTTDVHDTHKVDVPEHWNDNVDVAVKMETARFKGPDATPVTPGAKISKEPLAGGG